MSGAKLFKLRVVLKNESEVQIVVKQVMGASAATSKMLGLVREALFY